MGGDLQPVAQITAAGQVNGSEDQAFVHGQHGVAIAADALLVTQSLAEGLTQSNTDVLHGVMVIHPGVALARKRQVKLAVLGKEGQHVIQKAAAGVDFTFAGAVDGQGQVDIGFRSFADDGSGFHRVSSMIMSMVWINAAISLSLPMVMRM